jgi:hypothetical protein
MAERLAVDLRATVRGGKLCVQDTDAHTWQGRQYTALTGSRGSNLTSSHIGVSTGHRDLHGLAVLVDRCGGTS